MTTIAKIHSSIVCTATRNVLQILSQVGLKTMPVLCDGHQMKLELFKDEVRGDKIQSPLLSPYGQSYKLFLLFDSFHLFKNFYTKYLGNKILEKLNFHNFEGYESATFDHLHKL